MHTYKLQKSKLYLLSASINLLLLSFAITVYFGMLPGKYASVSVLYLLIFLLLTINNFFWWWATPRYSYVVLEEGKIIFKYILRKPSIYKLDEIKSCFFYKYNHKQIVLDLKNGKKEYIPVRVERQAEFFARFKDILIRSNLYSNEIDEVFNNVNKK